MVVSTERCSEHRRPDLYVQVPDPDGTTAMGYTFSDDLSQLSSWIRAELDIPARPVVPGDVGTDARRVQEWLSLHGIRLAIDGDFGPATRRGVERYQEQTNLAVSGEVDAETFESLVSPMKEVCRRDVSNACTLTEGVVVRAAAHVAVHPVEVGGANKGPWVRMYMKGGTGPWCAGFVTFALHQAAEFLDIELPFAGSFSCDNLAEQARSAGRFVAEQDVRPDDLLPGSIFLVRKSARDWTHTGVVAQALPDSFDTLEGNTDDAGGREGIEACAHTRGYAKKDFIVL